MPHEQINRELFSLFHVDGYLDIASLETIGRTMGLKPDRGNIKFMILSSQRPCLFSLRPEPLGQPDL